MWRCSLVALALSSACQFDRPVDQMPVDAPLVDAAPTCVADTITCAADTYVECGPDGFATRTLACPLGCAPDVAKCLDIDPLNGLATYLDMVADPPDIVLRGAATIDSASGLLFDAGTNIPIPMFDTPFDTRVYVVNSLTIDGSLVVAPTAASRRPIVFLSRGDVAIHGLVDVSANADLAGPGGRAGGNISDEDPGSGGHVLYANPTPGAGGGGGEVDGGAGGAINGAAGGLAGTAVTDHLYGGFAGGSVIADDLSRIARGGGGGGSLHIASRTTITVSGAGAIDASGGGGAAGYFGAGGSGGGAGGNVLLEAPQVVLDGANVVVSTKGGAGGGASSSSLGQAGADGGLGPLPAIGGSSPVGNIGGRGGTNLVPWPGGDATGGGVSGGGGGGSAGLVDIGTTAGLSSPANGAAIRGVHRDHVLAIRHVP